MYNIIKIYNCIIPLLNLSKALKTCKCSKCIKIILFTPTFSQSTFPNQQLKTDDHDGYG